MWQLAIARLTLQYSLLFLAFLTLFSFGIYHWADRAFADQFVAQVERELDPTGNSEQTTTLEKASEVAVRQFRSIIIWTDVFAAIVIPFGSYFIARRTVRPLRVSAEQQKQFIANASHELRTPLAVMSGELELALKKERTSNDYKHALRSNKQEVDRLTRMTNQLLELSRLDVTQKQTIKKQPVTIDALLESVKGRYATLAAAEGLILVTSPLDMHNNVLVNRQLIETALDNLVHNAIKYSISGTEVVLGVEIHNKKLSFYVENTPRSMLSVDEFKKMTGQFSRNDSSIGGFGLGLSIVKTITQLHQGVLTYRKMNKARCRFVLEVANKA